ncbi:MAG: sodium:solute symporter [Bacteroidota bacterium]
MAFEPLDWIVLVAYFVVLLGVAYWVIRQETKDTEDYFLAGRNVGWFVIGASIFASNIGSEHVVGLAGTGAAGNMPLAHYELHAWIVLLLGWLFLPFYMRSGVYTMPEFLEKRFDSRSRWFLAVFSILGYILTKVSVTIYAGGIVISNLLNLDFTLSALLTVLVTGLYTILGGMRAVVYTEAIQTVILIIGAFIITILGLQAVGGWSELKMAAGPGHFNMWRPSSDPDFPWTGMVFGGTIVGIWYWCTDQYIVQRTLSAANIKVGRRGAIFGAYLKILPIFIFLVPGIIAYVLKQKGLLSYEKSDEVFPSLVSYLLPAGLRGLVAAGLMAALMSSLASVFNSSSTIFTVDIFKKLYPESSEKRLLNIGRYATVAVMVIGFLWVPFLESLSKGTLYQYLQSVQAYIAPPITAVFLLGILWKRMTAQGSIAVLSLGVVLAAVRIGAELATGGQGTGLLAAFAAINFAHLAIYLFLFFVVIGILVSLLTAPPSAQQIEGLTLGSLTEAQKASAKNSYTLVDVAASLLLILSVIGVMVYFVG